ncbi:condensin-2 complex subunit H2-like [Lineus longissimus]|uniref:condensin-2 complex subunit H2-like n=1 Tax=Lineus longissimus TaxID=88925 RepID=UPI002B4CDBF7
MVIPASQASQGQGDTDHRFSYLLRPIRDLAKNWNVDIAHELEDFLDEVDQISISFDGGSTIMNFAEAALLVQGSACVYSKKVEYLYSLAYQVLDLVSCKKKLNQKASVDRQGNDKDTTFRNDVEEDFLSLDDITEHGNTDLKRGIDGKATIQDLPNTPLVLIKLDADMKGENSLLSRKGEVLGNKNDFKMNTSNLHMTGTMMLDLTHLALLEATIRHTFTTPQTLLQEDQEINRSGAIDMDVLLGDPTIEPMDAQNDSACGDDLGGFDDVDGIAEENPIVLVANVVTDEKQEGQEQMMRRSERTKKQVVLFEERRPLKIVHNHWDNQNPHSDIVQEKKFNKKSKTIKVPPELAQDTAKRKRKKTPALPAKENKLPPLGEFVATAFFSHSSKFPRNPLKVPSYPEFETLYWEEYKKRQTMHRKEAKMLVQQGRFDELEDLEDEDIAPQPGLGDGAADDDDDNDNYGFDQPVDPFPDDVLGLLDDGPEYEDAVKGSGFEYSATQNTSLVKTYEDLVRQHVESYISSAQQYAQITELSRRVSEWEEKILPKLEQEEENGVFDIHRYGSSVLDSFCEDDSPFGEDEKMPFRYIAQGKNVPDVCRLFAATLQLANNYNVEIVTEGCLDEGIDTMALRLLSTNRHHEALQGYRAPSIEEF